MWSVGPMFHELKEKIPEMIYTHKSLFRSNFVHKLVYIPASEHFSFAKIIHPPDRCGISRSWLNSMVITQVHLVLGTRKCAVLSHNTMPQMSQVLRECEIGMLTAGMSTRELNVRFSTISRFQYRFREFGSTSNRPHNRRPCLTTPAHNLHTRLLHLQDSLRLATRTADETEEYLCL
jgi:hypothetical protein